MKCMGNYLLLQIVIYIFINIFNYTKAGLDVAWFGREKRGGDKILIPDLSNLKSGIKILSPPLFSLPNHATSSPALV